MVNEISDLYFSHSTFHDAFTIFFMDYQGVGSFYMVDGVAVTMITHDSYLDWDSIYNSVDLSSNVSRIILNWSMRNFKVSSTNRGKGILTRYRTLEKRRLSELEYQRRN